MKEFSVKDLRPGMVLGKAATDLMGNPLFEAGTEVTENVMRTLRAWAVRSVEIEDEEIPPPSPAQAKEPGSARRHTRRLQRRSAPPPSSAPTPQKEAPAEEPAREESLEAELAALAYRFEPHATDPLMEKIRKIAEKQLRHRLGGTT